MIANNIGECGHDLWKGYNSATNSRFRVGMWPELRPLLSHYFFLTQISTLLKSNAFYFIKDLLFLNQHQDWSAFRERGACQQMWATM